MSELVYGLGFLALFGLSASGGIVLKSRLPREHLSDENMNAIRMMTGFLVTFAAVLLSLQLSTVRTASDEANKDRSAYAAALAGLDQCLRGLGAELDPTRLRLRQYTTAVIASTWPRETVALVEGMPDPREMAVRGENVKLAGIIEEVGSVIDRLAPQEPGAAARATRCRSAYVSVLQGRWTVIENTHGPSVALYVVIISFWLALVFLSFGLQIPRARLAIVVLAIGVVAVASVMFVIVDLMEPYTGFFGISSASMREALADMNR
jgi:hypothetical protein